MQLTADDVTVEYNASLLPEVYEDFQPLDASDLTNLKKFGTGTWQIRISWAETGSTGPVPLWWR